MTIAILLILAALLLSILACCKVSGDCAEIERQQEKQHRNEGDDECI